MRAALRFMLAGAWLVWGTPAAAQHEGHMGAGPQAGAASAEQLSACVQSQQQVMVLVEAANQRIELARQTNDLPAMRGAVDALQATLSAVRAQLASCAQLAAAAPPAEMVKDPKCRDRIDPTAAPQASHGGRTYFFCSESDRQRFVADPARYLQAAPASSAPADPHAGHAAPNAPVK